MFPNYLLRKKLKILYNHLSYYDIADDYLENIKIDHRYRKIVSHRNYNPRIIEYICNSIRHQKIAPEHFYDFICKHLENPKEMWKDEYEDRLKPEDRILLQTIYSLTNTSVDIEDVRQCFNRRILNIQAIDKTVDQFSRSLERLNEGFIKIIDIFGCHKLSVHNPSVNDFLNGRLSHFEAERSDLIASICMVSQLRLISESERIPYVVDLLQKGKIDQFIFRDAQEKTAIVGHCILSSGLCNNNYQYDVLEYIKNRHYQTSVVGTPLPSNRNIRKQILDTKIWDFYNLKTFFENSDNLYYFLRFWDLYQSVEFIGAIDKHFCGENRYLYVQQVEDYLREEIMEYCNLDASDYEQYLDVESAIRFATSYDPDGGEIDENEAAETLDECVRERALNDLIRNFRKIK